MWIGFCGSWVDSRWGCCMDKRLAIGFLMLGFGCGAGAENLRFERWEDVRGTTHYSNVPRECITARKSLALGCEPYTLTRAELMAIWRQHAVAEGQAHREKIEAESEALRVATLAAENQAHPDDKLSCDMAYREPPRYLACLSRLSNAKRERERQAKKRQQAAVAAALWKGTAEGMNRAMQNHEIDAIANDIRAIKRATGLGSPIGLH